MQPRLTKSQMRSLSHRLGIAEPILLFKASVHGYTAAAFHQRCDNHGPTVSVGYNNSGYVFGGYTSKPFSQTGQYGFDNEAFLFTFSGDRLLTYPVTSSAHAVRMMNTCGPYFGEALVLMNAGQSVVYSCPGKFYNFDAATMHGNDLQLIECEVYDVEDITPWRKVDWKPERKEALMQSIQTYKPLADTVSQVRVLLVGPVGAGKSSFFNSINSVFRGHVTSQAMAGCATTSLTTKFRTYSVKAGRDGKPLPVLLCDTMGLEEATEAGLHINDISSILKGHVQDLYEFKPSAPLKSDAAGYRKCPGLKDKIHCVVYVLDSCKISIMPSKLEAKLNSVRRLANDMGIPQLVFLTKVDEACPSVKKNVSVIYKSAYIKELVHEASARLGVPVSCVVPVKNYCEEFEVDLYTDILLLTSLRQMLRFADNYFDEISEHLNGTQLS